MPTKPRSSPHSQGPELPPGFPLHILVRLLISGLQTAEHVNDWLGTVALLPGADRAAAFRDPNGHAACIVVGYQVCASEQSKPPGHRN
jgi:hypothetical protein